MSQCLLHGGGFSGVAYHGLTKGPIEGEFQVPAYFTSSEAFASRYAEGKGVLAVRLELRNPLVIDAGTHALGADAEELANNPRWLARQLALGYDGLIVVDGEIVTYVAFSAQQIRLSPGHEVKVHEAASACRQPTVSDEELAP